MISLPRIVTMAILVLACGSPLFAQNDFWEQLEKPYGGGVFIYAFAPNGDIVVGTERHGVFRSTNNGATWDRVGAEVMGIYVMAVNAQGEMFGMTDDRGGMYRAGSDGAWEKKSAGLEKMRMRYIAMQSDGDLYVATDSGIYRSADRAETWSAVGSFTKMDAIFASPAGDIFAIKEDSLFRSGDDGATWTQTGSGVWSESISGITFSGASEVFILAGVSIYKSTNNGVSFATHITTPNGLEMGTLAIDVHGRFYTVEQTVGMIRLTQTDELLIEVPNLPPGDAASIAIAANGAILVGYERRGIYRSTDGGATWTSVGLPYGASISALAEIDGEIFAGVRKGVHRSSNGGASWTEAHLTADRVITIDKTPTGVMILGAEQGKAFRSTNGGRSWLIMDIDVETNVNDVLVTQGGSVLLASNDNLIRSVNDGVSWYTMIPDQNVYALAQASNGDIWAAGFEWIYRSTDDGLTWEPIHVTDDDVAFESVAALPDGSLLIGGRTGSYRSTNNGDTWMPHDLGCSESGTFTMHTGGDGGTYLGNECGIYRMIGGTLSMVKVADWPGNRASEGFFVSSSRLLYAGGNAGIFRSRATLGVGRSSAPSRTDLHLAAAPNPARDRVQITFSLPKPGHATLGVHSILGDESLTLIDEYLPAGEHTIEWDAAGAPSGTYLYRLRSGDAVDVGKIEVVR